MRVTHHWNAWTALYCDQRDWMSAVHFFTNAKDMNKWKPEKTHTHTTRTKTSLRFKDWKGEFIHFACSQFSLLLFCFSSVSSLTAASVISVLIRLFKILGFFSASFRFSCSYGIKRKLMKWRKQNTFEITRDERKKSIYINSCGELRKNEEIIYSNTTINSSTAATVKTTTTTNNLNDLCTFRFFFP